MITCKKHAQQACCRQGSLLLMHMVKGGMTTREAVGNSSDVVCLLIYVTRSLSVLFKWVSNHDMWAGCQKHVKIMYISLSALCSCQDHHVCSRLRT